MDHEFLCLSLNCFKQSVLKTNMLIKKITSFISHLTDLFEIIIVANWCFLDVEFGSFLFRFFIIGFRNGNLLGGKQILKIFQRKRPNQYKKEVVPSWDQNPEPPIFQIDPLTNCAAGDPNPSIEFLAPCLVRFPVDHSWNWGFHQVHLDFFSNSRQQLCAMVVFHLQQLQFGLVSS